MINTKILARKIVTLIVCFTLLSMSNLFAQSESYIQTLKGVLKPEATCIVTDDKFANAKLWSGIKTNLKVQNLVTFEIVQDTTVNFSNKPFACEVTVDIDYKDSSNTDRTIPNVKLLIDYDTAKGKPYKGIAYYKFDGGHQVQVTIKSITSKEIDVTKADFLRIKSQILIERTYNKRIGNDAAPIKIMRGNELSNAAFRSGNIADNNLTQSSTYADGHKMDLIWDPLDFEYDKYDVEYTFYDYNSQLASQNLIPASFTQQQLADAFKNNATRVSLDVNSYSLNLVFPRGYVLVRIRAYTYNLVDGEMDRAEGAWHYIGDATGINNFAVYYVTEHETTDPTDPRNHIFLNWQYSAAFAEEGKRKEVVSYFDGASKSRQSVTVSNSDNNAIVAESVLDKQNRPAVSILPVPVLGNIIKYYPAFNKNNAGTVYSYANFNPNNSCASTAEPLNTSFGSSLYYSPNNTWANDAITRDVPNANGFPMAVTEFTNDQTGRIRRQGGVGPTFQLGGGYETSYFYGKPAQEELDRLFGSEAGAAAHYAKNMVVDANGQVSISYTDIAGKTVATALAGDAPANLKPLETQAGAGSVIKDELIRPQAIVRDAANLKLSFNTTVLVPSAANYNFKYEFSGRSLELLFGFNPSKQICADCYYDVKFSINDECGTPVKLTFNGADYFELLVPATFNYGNSNPTTTNLPNTQCGVVLPSQLGNILAAFPKAGEYKVQYELLMSRKALDFYMEYIKQASVTKTITDIKKDYLKKIDLSGCFSDCRDCKDKLGTKEEFIIRITKILREVDNIDVTTDDIEWITLLYNETLRKCSESIAKNCTIIDGCSGYRKMMLKDVTPGGQYMLYDQNTLLFKERTLVANNYVNAFMRAGEDNAVDAPRVDINGTLKYIRDLEESEFITYWKPEWAYLMLQYHPEHCLLQECEQQSASKNRSKDMQQTDDDQEAFTKFGWSANNYTAFLNADYALIGAPYSQQCIRDQINVSIGNFTGTVPVKETNGIIQNRPVSLQEWIKYSVYCPDNLKAEPINGALPFVNIGGIPQPITCPEPLKEWRIFRSLYTAIKEKAYRVPECKTSGQSCGNCYIGVNTFTSMFNKAADPKTYPKPADFIIEAVGTGLQVRYNYQTPINNRVDVYISKATNNGGVITAVPNFKAEYTTNGTSTFVIPGASADDINVYFVEHIINNYNHNIDGTNPPSNCPNASDFDLQEIGGGCTGNAGCNGPDNNYNVKYISRYPLLNRVNLRLRVNKNCGNNYANIYFQENFDPLEIGPKITSGEGGCVNVFETRPGSSYCISTPGSCISDPRWPSYFQKNRRFYESGGGMDDVNAVLQPPAGNTGNTGTALGGDPQAEYLKNAQDMAEGWLEKLKGCLSADPTIAATQRATLRLRLIAVCVNGSDVNHPFGASSVAENPSGAPIATTSYGDNSFKDAIIGVFGAETPTCNAFAIDFPLPYSDKTPLNDELVNNLKECGYRLLTRWRAEWLAAGGIEQLPPPATPLVLHPTYPTLNSYIKLKYDPNFYLTDKQIKDLVISYTTGCPLKRPIRIPGILSRCDNPATPTCLKCSQLYNIEQKFHVDYPQFNINPQLPNYYELLAGYINQKFQMNVAPTAVYAAIEKCKNGGNYDDGCVKNMCPAVIAALQKFYQVMPLSEYYLKIQCKQGDCFSMLEIFKYHITAWLNINLGLDKTYDYYYETYFSGCASKFYQQPFCGRKTGEIANAVNPCACTPYNITCCDDYPPFTIFRSLYPNPVDPRLMALFFEMRNYTVCHPSNLPNIEYTTPYDELVAYFDNIASILQPCVRPEGKNILNANEGKILYNEKRIGDVANLIVTGTKNSPIALIKKAIDKQTILANNGLNKNSSIVDYKIGLNNDTLRTYFDASPVSSNLAAAISTTNFPINLCLNAIPMCSISQFTQTSPTNVPSMGGYGIFDCLATTPNPTWYYLKISTPGNIVIDMVQREPDGTPIDVDFAVWGPFVSKDDGCKILSEPGTGIMPIDCSYSTSAFETVDIIGAQTGEIYILLVTNYSGRAGTITFTPGKENTGNTDCKIVNPPLPCNNIWNFTYAPIPPFDCANIFDPNFEAGELVLCSSPLTPVIQSDPDACIKSTINAALSNAEYAYNEYIKEFMRDYREAYFAKCLSITPSLLMTGDQKEYHYTLYYYDQSGNLVKTVPPKGVTYLNQTQIAETGRLRDEDNGDCYKNSTAPDFADITTHKVSVPFNATDKFFDLQDAGPLTVESWVRFNNTSTKQILIDQFKDAGAPSVSDPTAPAGKAGYYAYIENGKLYFSLYGSSRETWEKKQVAWLYGPPSPLFPNVTAHSYTSLGNIANRVKQFKAVCNTENLITSIGGTNNGFYHIVFQYSGDPNASKPVKIYVNGVLQTLNWTAAGNGSSYQFTDGLVNIPSTQIPTIDATKYVQVSVQSPFTTAPVNTDLTIGAITRTIDGITAQGVQGRMKHLRIYNTAPDAADLRRNSFDGCFVPTIKEGLVLWLPLNKQLAGGVEDVQSGRAVPITANWDNPAQPQYPLHRLPTYYAYNSLNQVTHQETPDAGESNFYYDRLGRLVVSQNAEQKTATNSGSSQRFSYTQYDEQGRIKEVGEKLGAIDIASIDTRNNAALNNWLAGGTDVQVTETIYDKPNTSITIDPQILAEQQHFYNSRKRVVTSLYRENKNALADYNYATHYVYDISGNVKRLYQENKKLPNGIVVNNTKTMDYDFDLISGKVNKVWYQKNKQDQYLYTYAYDADNRITDAQSGRDELTLRHDARYKYYRHGPLGRTELAHDIVQGVDYAYTLQGWLKGINGLYLNERNVSTVNDLGEDGVPGATNQNSNIPADVYGYTLGYYGGDYTPINTRGGLHPITSKTFTYNSGNASTTAIGNELFNGNIGYTSYANRVLGTTLTPNSYAYQYDQLNRLAKMRTVDVNGLWKFTDVLPSYAEDASYDANGNILTYSRKGNAGNAGGLDMDMLTYQYPKDGNGKIVNNRLRYVHDAVVASAYTEDIDNQTSLSLAGVNSDMQVEQVTDNYNYDKIGNLIKDNAGINAPNTEKITDIQWTVYGKIRKITKADGTLIEYGYDPTGNRISKTVNKAGTIKTTFYYRDASGNTMGVYEKTDAAPWKWTEQNLYGSSRLGVWNSNITMDGTIPSPYDNTLIGSRHYELTNHLGNVMATVSDRKLLALPNNGCQPGTLVNVLNVYTRGSETQYKARLEINFLNDNAFESNNNDYFETVLDATQPECVPLPPAGSYFIAEVITAGDYYPFGMNMPGRKYSVGSGYRYGFNGKELDNSTGEGNLDFGARIMDVRLGRWLSTDPKTSKYPGWSPYNFAINNPINVIDPDGEDIIFIVRNNDGSVKEQLKYMKGNFWHSNGTRYNPQNESLSPTMFKVLTAYRQIEKSNDKILKGQLHHLEDSKFKHYLQELPAGQGSSVERFNSKVRSAAEIAEGSGTNTGFDFSKEASTHFEKSEGVKNSDLSVVAHEMRHQYDSDIANQKDNSDNNNETDPAEIRAVSNENRARKLENLPLRKTYGGRKIDPKKLANPPNNLQPKTPKSK
jgi:RHS repeat-associated protein